MGNKTKQIKIGLIARADNSGLGSLSYDFYRHLPISKVLVVLSRYPNFPDRYPNGIICKMGIPSLPEITEFLTGLDVVITFETPYNWNIFSRAKEMGIKTILVPMYEWTEEKLPEYPDLFLCPSPVDYEVMPEPKKYLPIPIDRKKFPFKIRGGNKVFIFNNGHGGFAGRNGLREFLEAISLTDIDAKFYIRSQVPFQSILDERVETFIGEIDHTELWNEGDIYVHLHKFDGLSLPIQEAMSAGFPIIAVDKPPYNEILDKRLLIKPRAITTIKILRKVEAVILDPVMIKEKIEEVYNMSNKELKAISLKMGELAEKWSWRNLRSKYLKVIEDLCQKEH